MRKALFNILNTAGLSAILRSHKKNKLTVLSLHRISYDEDFFWNPIKPDTFETLLQYLIRHYSIISFSDIAALDLNAASSKPYLILSFDDGYYDFYEHALPLLIKYDLPCNHNIVNACATNNHIIWTQRLNSLFNHCRNNGHNSLVFYHNDSLISLQHFKNNWMQFYLSVYNLLLQIPLKQRIEMLEEKENIFSITTQIRMMNWKEITVCSRNKVEIGCHTYNHDVLSTIEDKNILHHEIVESVVAIEKQLNQKITVLALPNGQANKYIHELAAKAGIQHVLFVGDKINELNKYTNGAIHDTYRINLVQESIAEMILRTELFHSKIKRYA